jgi:predicted transcriptional regulator YdeE
MRKLLLLTTISLACIYAGAQQINQTLLVGQWRLSSFATADYTFRRDSMALDIKNLVLKMTDGKSVAFSYADSVKLMKKITPMFSSLFEASAKFSANGDYMLQVQALHKGTKEKGKYEWTAGNKLTTRSGKQKPDTFVVIALTADRLVLTFDNDKDDKDHLELGFTRE